jgi:hypothetical protein
MDTSSSAPPTHKDYTASAPSTGQLAKLPSYAQLTESLDGAAKKRKLWLDDEDILIIYSKHKGQLSKPSVAIVIRLHAIPQAAANAACESLNKEIFRKKEEGALKAGESSSVKLEWTIQTQEIVRIYEDACANLESNSLMLQSLDGNPKGSTKWACPIVYGSFSWLLLFNLGSSNSILATIDYVFEFFDLHRFCVYNLSQLQPPDLQVQLVTLILL